MAMLAEPRRKTKWTLNPRGKLWSEDSNKFGQKLLEKMGWKAGKGLGAKEQGVTSHIHVQVKSDNTGVGFKGKDTDWCKHQSHFDKILASLSENISEVENHMTLESLEERSKASKARLHYHKFTRGKDVSKYSTKDLGCILGVQGEKTQADCDEDLCKVEDIGAKDDSFGVKTIVGGSIDDYLNRKKVSKRCMKAVEREDGQEAGENGGRKRKADEDQEWQGVRESVEENEETVALLGEEKVNKRRKKKSKLKIEEEEEGNGEVSNLLACIDESDFVEGNVPESVVELEKSRSKSGKRKKKSKLLDSECVDESPESSPCDRLETKGLQESVIEKKKKKKKRSKSGLLGEIKENLSIEEPEVSDVKGERVCKNGIGEESVVEEGNGVGRRKKKHAKLEDSPERVNGAPVDGTCDNSASVSVGKSKKKKSAGDVEMMKCDPSLSTESDIFLGYKSRSIKRGAKEVVGGDEGKPKRKSKVKSELYQNDHYHSILDRKQCDKMMVGSSCKMFLGANLVDVEGYGTGSE